MKMAETYTLVMYASFISPEGQKCINFDQADAKVSAKVTNR